MNYHTDFYLEFLLVIIGIIAFMIFGYVKKKTDWTGSVAGGFIAILIYVSIGIPGLIYLLIFFMIGSYASKWKYREKVKLGVAQENKGKRTAINAFSNAGPAAFFAILSIIGLDKELAHVAIACIFAAATSDTLSSEIGNIIGKQYYNIITFKQDNQGEDGVVSPEGSLAGVAGSLMITLLYVVFTFDWVGGVIVFFIGIASNVLDSLLGATLQKRGILNNNAVNLIATFLAGIGGIILFLLAYLIDLIL